MTLESLAQLVNANDALVRRGRFLSTRFVVGVGDTDWLIQISNGRVASATPGPHLMESWDFSIRASEADWRAFWQKHPRPGHHDIFAMTKSGAATIEGDLRPLMANLRYVKEVLEAPRAAKEALA
jgi:hypothetical protein